MLNSSENRTEIYSTKKITPNTYLASILYKNFSIISGKILALTLSGYPQKRQAQHFWTFTVKGKQRKVVSEEKNRISRNLNFSGILLVLIKNNVKNHLLTDILTSRRPSSAFFTHSKIKTAPVLLHFALWGGLLGNSLAQHAFLTRPFSLETHLSALFSMESILLVVNTLVRSDIKRSCEQPPQHQGKLEHDTGTADPAKPNNSHSAKSCQVQNGKLSIFKH